MNSRPVVRLFTTRSNVDNSSTRRRLFLHTTISWCNQFILRHFCFGQIHDRFCVWSIVVIYSFFLLVLVRKCLIMIGNGFQFNFNDFLGLKRMCFLVGASWYI